MGKKDPRIDAYIARSREFARPILNHLRRLVHAVCPEVEETWKWSFPHFMYRGMYCSMAGFKNHCAFTFWHKSMRSLLDEHKSGHAMGQLGKITTLADLPADRVLTRSLKQAMKLNEQGIKPPPRPRKTRPVKVPAQIKAALATNAAAQKHFAAMSPSQQREYVEWIAEAKRPQTVAARIATMLRWLAEGKSRNWKYER